jgi:hypothetical protein
MPLKGRPIAISLAITVALVGQLGGCGTYEIQYAERPPSMGSPTSVVTLNIEGGFRASGGWIVNDCQLLLIGARWGTVVLLDSTISHPRMLGRLPEFMESAQVSGAFSDGSLAIWSRNPKRAVRFPLDGTHASLLPSLSRLWGADVARPIVPIDNELFVTVAAGDVDDPQAEFGKRGSMPSLALYDIADSLRDGYGGITDPGKPYRSWYASLSVPGRTDSGAAVVHLDSAKIDYFSINNQRLSHERTIRLPRYFAIPEPSITTAAQPWIDVGGDVVRINHVRDIGPVAIASNGYVTAVRTYTATREWIRAGVLPAERLWRRGAIGIEVYAPAGNRVYSAPVTTGVPTWISTSRTGRVVYGVRGGGVRMIDSREQSRCPVVQSNSTVFLQDTVP